MQTFSRLGRRYSYNVFLNFRGIDTRSFFIEQLYRCLKLFRCFKDNPELQLGDKLTEGLNEGIEGSRIFVIVISENYASSSFCLNELVKILDEFAKQNGRRILTVFYHTSPSDVLHQTGSFGRAFSVLAKSATPQSLDIWIKALSKVGSIDFSSWHIHVPNDKNGSEYECVKEIVREVSKHVPYPIGLSDRVHKVLCYLSNGNVCLLGLCGNPGIGKSTIASSVYCYYNTISNASNNNFDYCCFIDKFEEYLSEYRLLHLKRKVFIVFEDVDDPRHLETIVNDVNNWFGSGSKVVITAPDKCFLEHHGIKNIYDVERFGDDEAYELLGMKVFNSDKIPGRYLSVFVKAKTYACGNPFHLELVGSYLGGKNVEECINALDRFELIPKEDTKMILQMSFDALKKDHQTMLIDILDFKERDLADVEDMLRRKNGVCPKRDIRVLLETSLISIDDYGRVRLHALTQDMVRDISHSKQHLSQDQEYHNGEPNIPDVIEVFDFPELEHQSSYE